MKERAYAKVNIFLKITGTRGDYHTLSSRFMRLNSLWDTLIFEENPHDTPFELVGDFGCAPEENSIYKAYRLLLQTKPRKKIEDFFKKHTVRVLKRIPEFAGLGGGSSDAATFLSMTNRIVGLGLNKADLYRIGMQIGADVPFFLSQYESANVGGIGELITPFDEAPLSLSIFTPEDVKCETAAVYRRFRERYLDTIDIEKAEHLQKLPSETILERYDASTLNDLLRPALDLCAKLHTYQKEKWFFSGSGSTFFGIENG